MPESISTTTNPLPLKETTTLPNTQEAEYCQTPHGQQTLREQLLNRLATREQIEQWTGLIGNLMLSKYRKAGEKNREAEDAAVRQKLYGETEDSASGAVTGGAEMGDNVVLGGIHHPPAQPAVIYPPQPPPKQGLGTLPAVLLGAAIPAAAVAGYLWQENYDDRLTGDDTSISIGLGKEADE